MFKINKDNNEIIALSPRRFSDLGFKERAHLQEWIAKEPSCLGEELLIIQKEFAGFSETNERLDLLALDKQGSLVIIENKLDDSGKDVTWQALKYASYCSSLSKENIRKIFQEYLDKSGIKQRAEEALVEFFEDADYEELQLNKGVTQRIMLIAAKFRKEVTSTVLWLSTFKIRLQCFKLTPYSMGEQLFLNIEQIIPTKDAEEYSIGLAEKAHDEVTGVTQDIARHRIRREFWSELLEKMNKHTTLYQNISPGKLAWLSAGSGVRGLGLNVVGTRAHARVELYIDRGNKEENKFAYDWLHNRRQSIEAALNTPINWDRLNDNRASRLRIEAEGNVYDKDRWGEMVDFMVDTMVKFHQVLQPLLPELNGELKYWSE